MENELHLTRKDFELEWYSGSGAGGQHRNKHQNCCKITHINTGIVAIGTSSKSRVTNQRQAFNMLAKRLVEHYFVDALERRNTSEVIRTYHSVRNDVKDMRSGKHLTYKEVLYRDGLSQMIEARRNSFSYDV